MPPLLLFFCGLLVLFLAFPSIVTADEKKSSGVDSHGNTFFTGCHVRNGGNGSTNVSTKVGCGLTVNAVTKKQSERAVETQKFYYDDLGYLIVNGKVPGVSSPIVLDYKTYANTCTSNVYFFFAFQSPGHAKIQKFVDAAKKNTSLTEFDAAEMLSTCPYGITFCYESQLDGPGVRDEYKVTNYIAKTAEDLERPAHKIAFQCMLIHNTPNSHGFNMAVVAFPGLSSIDIKYEDESTLDLKKYPWKGHFYVFTLSITKDEYYFPVPMDGRVMLQIGDHKSLETYLTDSNGNHLKPVKFTFQGKTYGTTSLYGEKGKLPDPYNKRNVKDYAGLWMLYLDFKRRYNELQVVQAVNSEDCNMRVEIRGNRMRKCRTYLQDIVVTEPSDAELDFVYTAEVGTVRKSDDGQENIQEMLRNQQREELRKTTTKDTNTTTNETQSEKKEETLEKKTHEEHKKSQWRAHATVKGYADVQMPKQPVAGPGGTGGGAPPGLPTSSFPSSGAGGSSTLSAFKPPAPAKPASGPGPVANLFGAGGGEAIFSMLKSGGPLFANEFFKVASSAGGGGLINEVMSRIDGSSDIGKGLINAMTTVQSGIDVLNKIKDSIPAINKVTEFMKIGQEGLKKFGDFSTDLTKAIDPLMQQITNAIPGSSQFNQSVLKLSQLNEEFTGIADAFKSRTGIMSTNFGSLIGQSYDSATGWMSKMGQDIATLGNLGETALNQMTKNMQNVLPTTHGGSLNEIFEPLFSLKEKLPPGSKAADAMSGMNIIDNLPKGFLSEQNINLNSDLLGVLDDFKLPSRIYSSFIEQKSSAGSNLDDAQKNALDHLFLDTRQTGGNLFIKDLNFDKSYDAITAGIPQIGRKYLKDHTTGKQPGKTGTRRHKRQQPTPEEPDGGKIHGHVGLDGKITKDSGKSSSTTNEKQSSDRASNRLFNDVTKSQSLMQSFKSTRGITTEMSQSEYIQSSQAFTKKERIDLHVTGIQKHSRVILSQFMFECDGNVIQLPKYYFHDGNENIEGLSESPMGPLGRPSGINSGNSKDKDKEDSKDTTTTKAPEKDKNGKNKASLKSMPTKINGNQANNDQSMIQKLLADGHNSNITHWDNMTLAERAQSDPSFLFKNREEEEEEGEKEEENEE